MPQVHHVKKSRKAYRKEGIKKGEPYYWWKTRRTRGKQYFSTLHRSTKKPRPSQLTSSEFMREALELCEQIEDAKPETIEDLISQRDEWVQRAQEIQNQEQEKYDALPTSLQEGSSGEQIQERVTAMETFATELEGVSINEDGDEEELEERLSELQSVLLDV